MGECISKAIIDTGCSKTVCGELWLEMYLESLSKGDRNIFSKNSTCKFKFGDGNIYESKKGGLG